MLSKEAIEEFKEIYLEEFNEKLSDEEAYNLAVDLLQLVDALLDPDSPVENTF